MTSIHQTLYRERLRPAQEAVALIPSGAKIAMPIAAGQPPGILAALAERARAHAVENIRLYYLLCTGVAGASVFDFDLRHRIIPISYFHGGVERALDKRRLAEALPAVDLVPASGQQKTPHPLPGAGFVGGI